MEGQEDGTTLRQPLVKMFDMDNNDSDIQSFDIECRTCVATGTTACTDCVVAHLLANEDGPIDLVAVSVARRPSATERAISLFDRAGLLGDPVEFASLADFERGIGVPVAVR